MRHRLALAATVLAVLTGCGDGRTPAADPPAPAGSDTVERSAPERPAAETAAVAGRM
ncbi:hypothetical protein [Micromonospora sp. NBS 11-29]|uniref:hypothetical protein n=1 Tax=Micromonospora sp. NBS 11-29 TaxID=1960879 RepID=UPI0015935152|nr:hypothetical protein [Micromonospora sp. NBS 11-29]